MGSNDSQLDRIAQDYPRAEITTAILHERETDRHIIFYAVAELCPPDQPPSPRIGVAPHFMQRERLDDDALTLYVRRDLVEPSAALTFFRGVDGKRSIQGVPPLTSAGQIFDVTRDEEPILIRSNIAETAGVGAMLPPRPTAVGVLSKYDTTGATRRCVGDRAASRATDMVREILGVDLRHFAEHVGAIHLCFANPILRRFERSITADEKTLLVRCYERAGRSSAGCEIELLNEWDPIGTGFSLRQSVDAPFLAIPLPAPPRSLRVRLFDGAGRCIEDESSAFIRKFNLDLAVMSERRLVLVSPRGEKETHILQTVARDRKRRPQEAPPEPLTYLAEAQRRRELDDLAVQRVFLYFGGGEESRREAREVVRELLAEARTRCDVVDPYLSGNDVGMFVPFITHHGCKVRLLSSSAYLHGANGEEAHLLASIQELRPLPLSVEGRKLPGRERSPVHDRLLVIDDTVYLLGSSLAEFGSRATTIFRVPDATRLLAEVEKWWEQGLALEDCADPRVTQ